MKRAKIKNKNKKGYVDIEKMGLRLILESQRVLQVLKKITRIMLIDINQGNGINFVTLNINRLLMRGIFGIKR